jgi:hypothetical protein
MHQYVYVLLLLVAVVNLISTADAVEQQAAAADMQKK